MFNITKLFTDKEDSQSRVGLKKSTLVLVSLFGILGFTLFSYSYLSSKLKPVESIDTKKTGFGGYQVQQYLPLSKLEIASFRKELEAANLSDCNDLLFHSTKELDNYIAKGNIFVLGDVGRQQSQIIQCQIERNSRQQQSAH